MKPGSRLTTEEFRALADREHIELEKVGGQRFMGSCVRASNGTGVVEILGDCQCGR